jgi:hypothetical protein
MCRAEAIGDIYANDLDDELAELGLRCGACQTWRSVVLASRRAVVLERRVLKKLKRDRRDIQAAVWRAELGVEDADRPKASRV